MLEHGGAPTGGLVGVPPSMRTGPPPPMQRPRTGEPLRDYCFTSLISSTAAPNAVTLGSEVSRNWILTLVCPTYAFRLIEARGAQALQPELLPLTLTRFVQLVPPSVEIRTWKKSKLASVLCLKA